MNKDPMSNVSINDLVDSWLRYQDRASPVDEWAIFDLQELLINNRDRAWQVIVLLMKNASNQWQATMIGASPLEDILNGDGSFLDRLEQIGPVGHFFNKVLEAVWLENALLDRRLQLLKTR